MKHPVELVEDFLRALHGLERPERTSKGPHMASEMPDGWKKTLSRDRFPASVYSKAAEVAETLGQAPLFHRTSSNLGLLPKRMMRKKRLTRSGVYNRTGAFTMVDRRKVGGK